MINVVTPWLHNLVSECVLGARAGLLTFPGNRGQSPQAAALNVLPLKPDVAGDAIVCVGSAWRPRTPRQGGRRLHRHHWLPHGHWGRWRWAFL